MGVVFWTETVSPITGRKVPVSDSMTRDLTGDDRIVSLNHSEDGYSHVCMSHRFLLAWVYDHKTIKPPGLAPALNASETSTLAALLRSYAWRTVEFDERHLVPCLDDEFDRLADLLYKHALVQYFDLRSLSSLVNEVKTLGLEQRSIRTLENMLDMWAKNQSGGLVSAYLFHGKLGFVFRYNSKAVREIGVTFGTPDIFGHLVYEHLIDNGLIRVSDNDDLHVTARGAVLVERERSGRKARPKQVFVIRRYDPDLDPFLRPICEEVGRRLGLDIKAVWETEHNEKIDERILRLIRESAAVLLHVTNDRFNVGMEAGYALALGKPIVTIREAPPAGAQEHLKRLPFDILTMNCYDYDPDDSEALIAKLEARLALAVPALTVIR